MSLQDHGNTILPLNEDNLCITVPKLIGPKCLANNYYYIVVLYLTSGEFVLLYKDTYVPSLNFSDGGKTFYRVDMSLLSMEVFQLVSSQVRQLQQRGLVLPEALNYHGRQFHDILKCVHTRHDKA